MAASLTRANSAFRNPLGMSGDAIKVERDPTGPPRFPIQTRATDALRMLARRKAKRVVVKPRFGIGVSRHTEGIPRIESVSVGGLLAGYRLAAIDPDVDLRFHPIMPLVHQVGIGRRLGQFQALRNASLTVAIDAHLLLTPPTNRKSTRGGRKVATPAALAVYTAVFDVNRR